MGSHFFTFCMGTAVPSARVTLKASYTPDKFYLYNFCFSIDKSVISFVFSPVSGSTVKVKVTFSNFLEPTISIDNQVSQFTKFLLKRVSDVLNVDQ